MRRQDAMEVGESLDRRDLFEMVPRTYAHKERCLICGKELRHTCHGANALARNAHLRTHAAVLAPWAQHNTSLWTAKAPIAFIPVYSASDMKELVRDVIDLGTKKGVTE